MKKFLCIMLALCLCVLTIVSASALTKDEAQQVAAQVTETVTDKALVTSPFIDVIASVQQSVVGVNNYQNYTYYSNPSYGYGFGFGFGFDFGGGRTPSTESVEKLAATGSGVVVYDGLVLTNYHVVEDASRVTISVLNDENEYDGTVIVYDEAQDLAVIYAPELALTPVPLGDSDQLQVGEWAICIGNPLTDELKGTVTTGIISALDRAISSTTTTDKYGLKTTVKNTMIQTDAAINNGNSGGGLFNVLGQLMGVPSMKYSGSSYSGATIEGIGMAIPINSAKPIISEAIVKVLTEETDSIVPAKDSDSKTVISMDKPMLGVTVSEINASNQYMVYTGVLPGGLLISEVVENGPAAAAGLQPYDIIVEAEGEITTTTSVLRQVLDTHSYGDTVSVKVYRVEGLAEAQSVSDVGSGEYIDFEVALFAFDETT